MTGCSEVEWVGSVDELAARYGTPGAASLVKVADRITPIYARLIEASNFMILGTVGETALDCSPRGDAGPVVRIVDERTVWIPDWRGNDRIDSLRNIVRDPRVGLIFLIRGSGTTVRLNGRARVTMSASVVDTFIEAGRHPRSVIAVEVETVFFQCARAVVRSKLWSPAPDIGHLPTPGDLLAAHSEGAVGGAAYDAEWPERAARTLW